MKKSAQVNLKLDVDVLELLKDKAWDCGLDEASPGRIGGVTEYIRRLIYHDLNIPMGEDPHVVRGREQAQLLRKIRQRKKRAE